MDNFQKRSLEANVLQNIPFYISLIARLANYGYKATTWPTNRNSFSTIFIKGWEFKDRNFSEWYLNLRTVIDQFSKSITGTVSVDIKGSTGETFGKSSGEALGFSVKRELLLIPQIREGVLDGNGLLYSDLLDSGKRREITNIMMQLL